MTVGGNDFLETLEKTIQNRLDNPRPDSYTSRLAEGGELRAAKKLAEEAAEVALAAVAESPQRLTEESADLLYHLLVLLRLRGLSLDSVIAELEGRHRSAP